jgi:hypothetical protein
MKFSVTNCGVRAIAVLGASLLLFVFGARAQNAAPAAKGSDKPTPRSLDGHPDLTGFWAQAVAGIPGYGEEPLGEAGNLTKLPDGSFLFLYGGAEAQNPVPGAPRPAAPVRSEPSYKPEYAAKVKEILATVYGNTTALDPLMDCKPLGVPRTGVGVEEHLQIVQNPQVMAFLWENDPGPVYRVIYMDGRPHPKDLDTSYMGHSIGHWEGDTLVVDVVGLNDETWIGGGTQGPRGANIHSDKEHVVERWTRKGDTLTYEATVDDPVMFTKPWVITPQVTHLAVAGDYIQPQMCVANDKVHLIRPSEKDQFLCTWCQKDPDAVYGPGASGVSKK